MKLLSAAVSRAMQAALNLALRMDPEVATLMKPLEGKSLSVTITDWSLVVVVIPCQDRVQLHVNGDPRADVMVSGSLADLMALGASEHPQSVLSDRDLEINGQLHVLMQYQKVFKQFEFDWEGWLARLIGPAVAHEVCRPLHATGRWVKDVAVTTRQDITEYLQEEATLLPPREAVHDFYEDIVGLQNRIERLAQTIALTRSE